jgi:hypothetical protein
MSDNTSSLIVVGPCRTHPLGGILGATSHLPHLRPESPLPSGVEPRITAAAIDRPRS